MRQTRCECHGVFLCVFENVAMNAVRALVQHLPFVFIAIVEAILEEHQEFDGICMGCYLGQDAHEEFPCPTITKTIDVILKETAA